MRFLKYLIEFNRLEAEPIDGRDIVERDGVEMNGVVCSLAAMGAQFEWTVCDLLLESCGCSIRLLL